MEARIGTAMEAYARALLCVWDRAKGMAVAFCATGLTIEWLAGARPYGAVVVGLAVASVLAASGILAWARTGSGPLDRRLVFGLAVASVPVLLLQVAHDAACTAGLCATLVGPATAPMALVPLVYCLCCGAMGERQD